MSDHRCNTCQYAGSIPGNAHITCNSPLFKNETDKFIVSIAIMGGTLIGPKFDSYGVAQGWAQWPVEFDPVWMESGCGLHSSLAK